MNIPGLTEAASKDAYGLLVMRKAMQTMTQQGQDMAAMLSQMGQTISPPHLGQNVDIQA